MISTCKGNAFDNDFTGCDCADAKRRIANGQINCDMDDPCPEGCATCELCLYYVVKDCMSISLQ